MTTIKKKAPPTALTTKFFADMLELEINIQTKDYDFKDIDQLVQLYAQAVEYYDYMKDAIKSYFMEKIQIVLASKESLRLIMKKQKQQELAEIRRPSKDAGIQIPNQDTLYDNTSAGVLTDPNIEGPEIEKNVRSLGNIKESSSDEEESGDEVQIIPNTNMQQRNSKLLKLTPRQSTRYSISKKRLERSKDFTFNMKVESSKKDLGADMQQLVSAYEQMYTQQDKLVKGNLDDQISKFRDRMVQKKMESFQNQTFSLKDFAGDQFDKSQLQDSSFDENSIAAEKGIQISKLVNKIGKKLMVNVDLANEEEGRKYSPIPRSITPLGISKATVFQSPGSVQKALDFKSLKEDKGGSSGNLDSNEKKQSNEEIV